MDLKHFSNDTGAVSVLLRVKKKTWNEITAWNVCILF
jgi:hypothetical protein